MKNELYIKIRRSNRIRNGITSIVWMSYYCQVEWLCSLLHCCIRNNVVSIELALAENRYQISECHECLIIISWEYSIQNAPINLLLLNNCCVCVCVEIRQRMFHLSNKHCNIRLWSTFDDLHHQCEMIWECFHLAKSTLSLVCRI